MDDMERSNVLNLVPLIANVCTNCKIFRSSARHETEETMLISGIKPQVIGSVIGAKTPRLAVVGRRGRAGEGEAAPGCGQLEGPPKAAPIPNPRS